MKKELKNIKNNYKIFMFFSIITITILLFSCTKINDPVVHSPIKSGEFPSEYKGLIKNKKVYITSFGQAIEIDDFLVFVDQLDAFEYKCDYKLKASSLEEGSVVLAVVGCSIKGMELTGTSIQSEIERTKDFTELKKDGKIDLITWHIGGMARRGTTSDNIISVALSGSTMGIFVETGNSDNYLTDILTRSNVPYYSIATIVNLDKPLKYLFDESVEEE